MQLKVKKLVRSATIPTRAHQTDAGYDLYAAEDVEIAVGARVQVKTGIALEVPREHVALVWDKSGLSHKQGLKVLGGVVDSGYRGEVMVGLINLGQEGYTVAAGDKVAQMLIQRYEAPEICEVEELEDADRGEAAFGSTGK